MPFVLRSTKSACLVLLLALVAAPGTVRAEPMLTSFDEVLTSSTDVVIARFMGPIGGGSAMEAAGYTLDVERALRGNLSGRIQVTLGDGHASFPAGTRLVAFLQNGAFRFVGTATGGHSLEAGAIQLAGFYDFNAHLVSPGLTTLGALVTRLGGRAAVERYEGPVMALSDDGLRRVATPWTVRVTLSDGQPPVVTGLPVRGFPTPTVGRGGMFRELIIQYRSSYPRPLQLEGRVVGRASAAARSSSAGQQGGATQQGSAARQGSVVPMEFWVVEPDVFRVSDLRRYLTDPDVDWVHYEVRAVMADGEIWRDGADGFDYSALSFLGHIGYESYSFRDAPRRWVNRRFTAAFDPARPGVTLDTYGDARVAVQELLRGPIGFRVESGEGAGRRGVLELVRVEFRSND